MTIYHILATCSSSPNSDNILSDFNLAKASRVITLRVSYAIFHHPRFATPIVSPRCLCHSSFAYNFETETRTTIILHINLPGSLASCGQSASSMFAWHPTQALPNELETLETAQPPYLDNRNTGNMGACKCARSPLLHDALVLRYLFYI